MNVDCLLIRNVLVFGSGWLALWQAADRLAGYVERRLSKRRSSLSEAKGTLVER